MGRLARVLLLAFAVTVLSAAPGRAAGELLAASPADAVASDPSSQLSAGLPMVRDASRTPVVEAGNRLDRTDPRVRQVLAAVLPAPATTSISPLHDGVDAPAPRRSGVVATCACGRGPPAPPLATSSI